MIKITIDKSNATDAEIQSFHSEFGHNIERMNDVGAGMGLSIEGVLGESTPVPPFPDVSIQRVKQDMAAITKSIRDADAGFRKRLTITCSIGMAILIGLGIVVPFEFAIFTVILAVFVFCFWLHSIQQETLERVNAEDVLVSGTIEQLARALHPSTFRTLVVAKHNATHGTLGICHLIDLRKNLSDHCYTLEANEVCKAQQAALDAQSVQ